MFQPPKITGMKRSYALEIVDAARYINEQSTQPLSQGEFVHHISTYIRDNYTNQFYGEEYPDGRFIYPFIQDYLAELQ